MVWEVHHIQLNVHTSLSICHESTALRSRLLLGWRCWQSLEQCPAEVTVCRVEYRMVSVTYGVQWQPMARSTSGYGHCASSWCASVYRSVLHTYQWSNKVPLCVLGGMNTVLKPDICVFRGFCYITFLFCNWELDGSCLFIQIRFNLWLSKWI